MIDFCQISVGYQPSFSLVKGRYSEIDAAVTKEVNVTVDRLPAPLNIVMSKGMRVRLTCISDNMSLHVRTSQPSGNKNYDVDFAGDNTVSLQIIVGYGYRKTLWRCLSRQHTKSLTYIVHIKKRASLI